MDQSKWDDVLCQMIEDMGPSFEAASADHLDDLPSERMMTRILRRVHGRIKAADVEQPLLQLPGSDADRRPRAQPAVHKAQEREAVSVPSRSLRSVKRTVRLEFEELESRNALSTWTGVDSWPGCDAQHAQELVGSNSACVFSQAGCPGSSEQVAVLW